MLVGGIVLFPSPRSAAGFRGRNSLALKVGCGGRLSAGAFSYTVVCGPFLSFGGVKAAS